MRLDLIHPRWLYISIRRYNHQLCKEHGLVHEAHALTDVIRLVVPGFGPTSHVRRPASVGTLSFYLRVGYDHIIMFGRRNRARNGVDSLFWARKGTLRI